MSISSHLKAELFLLQVLYVKIVEISLIRVRAFVFIS